LGARVKNISIFFSKGNGSDIEYTASFSFIGVAAVSIAGKFNVEDLIFLCSGLLCSAARDLKGRHKAYDMQLQRVMGR